MLSRVLLIVSLAMVAMGGLLDLTGHHRVFGLTREHYWNDGTYLAVLAIAVHLIFRV